MADFLIKIGIYIGFVAILLFAYALTRKDKRYIVLFVGSLIFYGAFSTYWMVFTIASVISIYFAGLFLQKINLKLQTDLQNASELTKEERKEIKKKRNSQKKWIVVAAILFNLTILAVLKYSGFFASMFEGILSLFKVSVHLPTLKVGFVIGLSYYTLSAIGYLIDVYRCKFEPEKNIVKLAVFVMFFPQAYEGPIARYDEMKPQYDTGGGSFGTLNIFHGSVLFFYGLIKKIVIADRLAVLASEIFSNYGSYSGGMIILGILTFTFQLYIDFSGFINMAQGVSNMFGINLAKNFEQPFFSQTVSEFWRRWHMSLGAWCKDYIFYSVSMSKGINKLNKKLHGKVNSFFEIFIPTTIATFVVWLVMGIWHGASWLYIIYGLYYFVVMVIGTCLEPLHNWIYKKTGINKNNAILVTLRIIRTFVLVNLGMLIFRASSITDAFKMFGKIFSLSGKTSIVGIIAIKDYVVAVIGTALMVIVDVLNYKKIFLMEKLKNANVYIKFIVILLMVITIVVLGAYGSGYTVVDPLYGGF